MSKQIVQGMAQTRRAFIGQGAFAFLAAAGLGHRAFGATGPARLKFGALSDIHITRGKGSCDIFEKALAYFRDQKVDAVLIAGDMADSGLDSQLRRVGETWRRVFPGDKRPDGEHVEKIFVTGKDLRDGQPRHRRLALRPRAEVRHHEGEAPRGSSASRRRSTATTSSPCTWPRAGSACSTRTTRPCTSRR